jgi:linoleoyl-CoA desaturase
VKLAASGGVSSPCWRPAAPGGKFRWFPRFQSVPSSEVPGPLTALGVTFPTRDPARFGPLVKERVAAHFAARGLSDKANGAMVAKTILLLLLTFGSYGLILSGWVPPAGMLALAMVMGVGMAGLGFSVAHDALHGAYSHRPGVNRALGLVFDLVGANGYMWQITHNVVHHTYTNITGVDEDLTVSPLLRLSPEAPHRPIHRFQHWYALLAYGLATLFWVFVKDYKYFLKRDLGPYRNRRHPPGAVATLLAGKAVYYGWVLVVPLLVLDVPWWGVGLGFVLMHLTAGIILGVVFQLAHVVEGVEYLEPDETGVMESAWMIHEMRTTSNFGRGNRLLTWYVGGLNHQVEHHLFPRVCSVHYPALSRIVEATARECGVPYHEHPTLRAAVRSHWRMLRRLGAGGEGQGSRDESPSTLVPRPSSLRPPSGSPPALSPQTGPPRSESYRRLA